MWARELKCIAAIEMSQRSRFERTLEWVAQIAFGRAVRVTAGPFQMTSCPIASREMVREGMRRLQAKFPSGVATSKEVARFWSGASARQPGAAISYLEAYEFVRNHVDVG